MRHVLRSGGMDEVEGKDESSEEKDKEHVPESLSCE